MNNPWNHRQRPERLERRLEFADYEATRLFLERLEALSQQTGRFPDISFGRTYVNLTIRPEQADAAIGEPETQLAVAIDALL
ncbi:MAG: 4a-hydroxytetrahydrobiopterin dehydratase [Cyanobium sp.]|jgi:4a-hydroxytetrahydrobiopterin dehydratase